MQSNELYLVVLPVIHLSSGLTEQILTLLPDKDAATEFFTDEVDVYIGFFQRRADSYLIGGHVTGYQCSREATEDGRWIVKVVQNVK